jgi:DNA primase
MHDRDALLASVDLAALADELLGLRRGAQRSPTWACPNPSHPQTGRTPPVSVFLDRRGDQRWACHGCGAGGTAIDLVMAVRHVGVRESLESLASWSGQRPVDMSNPGVPAAPARGPSTGDLESLTRYARDCARRLWQPSGRATREWLIAERRLPAEVLAANLVGADPGPGLQWRPDGVPRRAGAVLPALRDGRVVYAQIRRLNPGPGQPRYLSIANRLAPNPGFARYRPVVSRGGPLLVTEGPIDGLAAAAAGYDAMALFGVGGASGHAAQILARTGRRIVVAFDADDAGRSATHRLSELLQREGATAALLRVPEEMGDLAGWLASVGDWRATLAGAVQRSLGPSRRGDGIAMSL